MTSTDVWIHLETSETSAEGFEMRLSAAHSDFNERSVISLNVKFLGPEFLSRSEDEQLQYVKGFCGGLLESLPHGDDNEQ